MHLVQRSYLVRANDTQLDNVLAGPDRKSASQELAKQGHRTTANPSTYKA